MGNEALAVEGWLRAWLELGVADCPALRSVHADLVARYSEAHRHYHTTQHLAECFEKLASLRTHAKHPSEVEVALWFHDAIYDTRRHDNEALSAALASATGDTVGLDPAKRDRMTALVLATRHAALPSDDDERVLVDVDLSILGAPPARFAEYEAQVRCEYAWVPEPAYRAGRTRVLADFLARPQLFATTEFHTRFEATARDNIEHSLVALGEGAPRERTTLG